jgi:electron transport complex protein RnfC
VPIGISHRACIEACGGLKPNANRAIAGGPMMGFTLGSLDAPVTMATSGITVLTNAQTKPEVKQPCIHCGLCVKVCPLKLVPQRLSIACERQAWDTAKRYHLDLCMECGCCAYECPSKIPLVQNIRIGKATMPR